MEATVFLAENSYLPAFVIVALDEVGITRLSTSLVWLVILYECEKKTGGKKLRYLWGKCEHC